MVINGDCLEVMRKMDENSIDTIITDPPYHLTSITKRFGKKGSAPAKFGTDGAFQRASKGFMGKEWDGGDIAFKPEVWKECLRVAKPGATMLCFGGTRTSHRMTCAIEDAGWIIKDVIMWLYGSGFPKALDISKSMDKKAGAEREVVGVAGKSGSKRNSMQGDFTGGEYMETVPTTDEAKQWDGWKSHGLKPAYEIIIVAMKPNDGTYVNNALKWGVSGLNIDKCRIGTSGARNNDNKPAGDGYTKGQVYGKYKPTEKVDYNKGRFPANVILDEEAGKILDEQSGFTKINADQNYLWNNTTCSGNYTPRSDKGGASRFFKNIKADRFRYVAKASKSEKNAGCDGLEKKQKVFNGQSSKSSTDIKDVEERFTTQPAANNHPTCKPLKLMEYLCKLTSTPTGGVVLDPFMGSGTTGVACIKTGRDFIGIERDKDYYEISKARLKYYEGD